MALSFKTRGRHTTKDIFKPGERCQLAGSFHCQNCANKDVSVVVQVQEGAIFPMCETCSDWDMGWRQVAGKA